MGPDERVSINIHGPIKGGKTRVLAAMVSAALDFCKAENLDIAFTENSDGDLLGTLREQRRI